MLSSFSETPKYSFIYSDKKLNTIQGTQEFYKLAYYNFSFCCGKCRSFILTNDLLIGIDFLSKGRVVLIFDGNIDKESYSCFEEKVEIGKELENVDSKKIVGIKNICFRYIKCKNCGELLGIKVEIVNSEKAILDDKILLRIDFLHMYRHNNNAAGTKEYVFRTEHSLLEKINEDVIKDISLEFLPKLNEISSNIIRTASFTNEMISGGEFMENGYDTLNHIFTYLKNNDLI